MPRLVITKGNGVGRDHAIGTECVLGRAPDVDFPIEDTLVSRRHVRVYSDGDGYSLEDLGSRNGTVVNGRRIVRCSLVDGDMIGLGGTVLLFTQKSIVPQDVGSQPPHESGLPSSEAALGETTAVKIPSPAARPAARPTPAVVAKPAAAVAKPAGAAPAAAPAPSKAAPPVPPPLVIKKRRPLS